MKERKLSLSTLDPALRLAVEASRDKKAADIVVLDMRGIASFTDYFLIATGGSHRQLGTIADEIEAKLKEAKRRPSHIEGIRAAIGSSWTTSISSSTSSLRRAARTTTSNGSGATRSVWQ